MDILWNIFFNNDEEDDYDWQIVRMREQHHRIYNYFENVVMFYSLTGNNTTMYYVYFVAYISLMLYIIAYVTFIYQYFLL